MNFYLHPSRLKMAVNSNRGRRRRLRNISGRAISQRTADRSDLLGA